MFLFILLQCGCFSAIYGLLLPLTNPDGSVDITSVVNHVTFLEQTLVSYQSRTTQLETEMQMAKSELKGSTAEITSLKDELAAVRGELLLTTNEIISMRSEMKDLRKDFGKYYYNSTEIDSIKHDVKSNTANLIVLQTNFQSVNRSLHRANASIESILTDIMAASDTRSAEATQIQKEQARMKADILKRSSIHGHQQSIANTTVHEGQLMSNLTTTISKVNDQVKTIQSHLNTTVEDMSLLRADLHTMRQNITALEGMSHCCSQTSTLLPQTVSPFITTTNHSENAFFGKNITLTCNVTGSPPPTITWQYNKQNVFNAIQENNTLTLVALINENEGDYTCIARNKYGIDNATIHVTVTKPVEVKLEKPVILIDPSSGLARFKCDAEGDPKPTVTWSKYNEPTFFPNPAALSFGDGELIFPGISQTTVQNVIGIYICKADNGVSTETAYQVVASKITYSLDSNIPFNNTSMDPGKAYSADCSLGSYISDRSPLDIGFGPTDSICDSARKVGVLDKNNGSVTWYIRRDDKAQFINITTGLLSVDSQSDEPYSNDRPLLCEVCTAETCGLTHGHESLRNCTVDMPFCMTTLDNMRDGSRQVSKRCASHADCDKARSLNTSNKTDCRKHDVNTVYTYAFSCAYCCTTSLCNRDIVSVKNELNSEP